MTNNIQLQIEHPFTNFLLYNNQKYPINFDVFKFCSKYFYDHRHDFPENFDIDLTKYDPDDNIASFSPNEVIDFINYVQFKSISLTKDNVVPLHYFGHKYGIKQLITSTEEFIEEQESEVIINILKRKDLLSSVDLNFYEDKIASNFSMYINNEDILSLDIPSSVTSIGENAFKRCSSLTSISIPSSVTSIGRNAFFRCSSLTSILIPSSVTSIGEGAFNGCSSLTSILIPSSVTSIGKGAFFGCSSLTSVSIPSSLDIKNIGFSQKVEITRI